MSSYYDDYSAASEWSEALNNLENTVSQVGAQWSAYYGNKADRQLQWDMFNKQLDYYDPKSQKSRLEAAGYSPFINNAVTSGQFPDTNFGPDPRSAVSGILTAQAENAIRKISSHTAVMEAKNQAMRVAAEQRELAMKEDLFPYQRRLVGLQADQLNQMVDFLSSSMLDRLEQEKYKAKSIRYDTKQKETFAKWLHMNWRDYYDELYKNYKVRNSYSNWLMQHGDDVLDFQKSQADIMNRHWDILNNPFGLDIGTNNINSLTGVLNMIFRALGMIFGNN